jgi:hypothetical protein
MSGKHLNSLVSLSSVLVLALIGVGVTLGLGAGPVTQARAASHVYVRTDGHDVLCDGTADAPYPGSGGPGLDCAFATVQQGVDSVGSGGTVVVAAGTYVENVSVSQDLTLQGAGIGRTIVDGGASDSVFHIGDVTVSMTGVTIRNGNATWGGGIYLGSASTLALSSSAVVSNTATWGAGGIRNSGGTLTVSDTIVMDNVAGEGGGAGVYNGGGTLTISNSTIVSNVASGGGGGGISIGGGTLTILNSAVISNTADDQGGGIASWEGTLVISSSVVSGNRVRGAYAKGGGIFSDDATVLTNVVVSGNTADDDGGGIHNQDAMTMTNVTVSGNTADYGGGIFNTWILTLTVVNCTITDNQIPLGGNRAGGIQNYGNVTFRNTILAYNQGANCWSDVPPDATLISNGYNLDSGATCGFSGVGDMHNTDSMLGPLADNGGPAIGLGQPMLTHALLSGSPAIDAVTEGGCPNTDQRGVSRPMDGDGDGTATCDIGAFEFERRKVYLPVILNEH